MQRREKKVENVYRVIDDAIPLILHQNYRQILFYNEELFFLIVLSIIKLLTF